MTNRRPTARQRREAAQSRRGACAIAFAIIAFVAMLVAGWLADERTCAGTRNPAVCRLALMAGDTHAAAIRDGNRMGER